MKYESPIRSLQHAEFCRAVAESRYAGAIIRDEHGMRIVEDANGVTDEVRVRAGQAGSRQEPLWRLLHAMNYYFRA